MVPLWDFVVFMQVSTEIRASARAAIPGAEAIKPGHWRHWEAEKFIGGASHYNDGTREGGRLDQRLKWLEMLPTAVMRRDGARRIKEFMGEILAALPSWRTAPRTRPSARIIRQAQI
jgi:hypothetical protein